MLQMRKDYFKKPYFYAMILVTGGTGLVGAHLLYQLLQSHKKIRATHRSSSDLEAVRKVFSLYPGSDPGLFDHIEWVEANITQIPALSQAFKGITRVYHCAAYISFNPKNYRALKKANVEGTANVVNLCLSNSIEKLCYVSSIATLGDTVDGTPINEEIDWNPEAPNSVYAITKFGAEMEVWRGVQEGLPAVIVNPGVVLGEGFWHSGSGIIIKNAAKGSSFYTAGRSGFVDVRDVVRAMINLMEGSRTNERYILVSENLYYKELLGLLADNFGNKRPSRSIPKGTFKFLSYLDTVASFLFRSKRKLLKSMVDSMYSTPVYDASKIKEDMDFQFTPVSETIKRVVSSYSSS